MALESAGDFVMKMKQDKSFRDIIQSLKTVEDRINFVRNKGFFFSTKELMEASQTILMTNSVKDMLSLSYGAGAACKSCACNYSCQSSVQLLHRKKNTA